MQTHLTSPDGSTKPRSTTRKDGEHYVNNKEFSQAVCDYVTIAKKAEKAKTEVPRITEYIGRCFLKIAEGLSHKPNFVRYTYREEMVMDGVENCIKACQNYDLAKATRTGLPNAFGYFTQICYFAFLRRIMKEKKQQDIKIRYIEHAGVENFLTHSDDVEGFAREHGFIDVLKKRINKVKVVDKAVKEFSKKIKPKKNLEAFIK